MKRPAGEVRLSMRWFSIADEAFAGDERRTSKGIKMGGARDEWYEEEKQSLEKFSRLGNKLKTSCKTAQRLGKTMEGSVMAGIRERAKANSKWRKNSNEKAKQTTGKEREKNEMARRWYAAWEKAGAHGRLSRG
jgi:hypothetical protein